MGSGVARRLAVAFLLFITTSAAVAQSPDTLSSSAAEAHGAELEAKAKKTLEEIDFQHTLTFSRNAGMPAAISGVFRNNDSVAKVRAVLEIDGRLLIVPLRFFPAANLYRGTFPTPRTELNYQFQVIQPDGRAALSPLFYARANCSDRPTGSALGKPGTKPFLLHETAAKENRAEQLNLILDSIRSLTPEDAHE